MTEAIIVQGIVIGALLVFLFTERRRADAQASAKNESISRLIGEIEVRHAAERRELLNRITHPQHMPTTVPRRKAAEPKDKGKLAQVGTIQPPKEPA